MQNAYQSMMVTKIARYRLMKNTPNPHYTCVNTMAQQNVGSFSATFCTNTHDDNSWGHLSWMFHKIDCEFTS